MRKAHYASALLLAVALTGCTSVGQNDAAPTATSHSAPSTTSTAPAPDQVSETGQLAKTGAFVSQGATTTGTITLASSPNDEFTITLDSFSTGTGDDLRLQLSTGALVQGADGNYYVDGDALEMPGKVDANVSTQTFVYDAAQLPVDEFRSVTVYDYAHRVALGSAALD